MGQNAKRSGHDPESGAETPEGDVLAQRTPITKSNQDGEPQTLYPRQLTPPPMDAWGNQACIGHGMEGAASDLCNNLATVRIRGLGGFRALDPEDAARHVIVHPVAHHRLDPEQAEMIHLAWAMLRDNLDLLRWAICWVTGNPDAGDCLELQLTRNTGRVVIQLVISLPSSAFTPPFANTIYVESIDRRHDFTACAKAFATRVEVDRLCATLQMASFLAHELTHTCWLAMDDWWPYGTCFSSYLFENAVKWGLYGRYPEALSSACCSRDASGSLPSPDIFGSDASIMIGSGCVP